MIKKINQYFSSLIAQWQQLSSARKLRYLIISLVTLLLIILVIVFLALNISITPAGFYTHRSAGIQIDPNLPTPPDPTSPVADPLLARAQAILAHFDPIQDDLTDSRGFYGDSQYCDFTAISADQPSCQVNLVDFLGDGSLFASHRSTVQLLWARYQYYLATGNRQQLQYLLDDLENLITNVLDNKSYVLENAELDCLLLAELGSSIYLDTPTQEKIARVCLESDPEIHPESAWEYTQFHHVPYTIINFGNAAVPDPERVIPDSARQTVTAQQQISELDQMLTIVSNKGVLAPSAYTQKISDSDKYNFLQRHINGALHYLGALALDNPDSARYLQNEIDYLLLTKEATEWVLTSDAAASADNSCLVGVNLRYYLANYSAADFTSEQLEYILAQFPPLDDTDQCLLVADLLTSDEDFHFVFAYQLHKLLETRMQDDTGDPGHKIVTSSPEGDGYIYFVTPNIFEAGLLSRYHLVR
jgi:hypothetical protein